MTRNTFDVVDDAMVERACHAYWSDPVEGRPHPNPWPEGAEPLADDIRAGIRAALTAALKAPTEQPATAPTAAVQEGRDDWETYRDQVIRAEMTNIEKAFGPRREND